MQLASLAVRKMNGRGPGNDAFQGKRPAWKGEERRKKDSWSCDIDLQGLDGIRVVRKTLIGQLTVGNFASSLPWPTFRVGRSSTCSATTRKPATRLLRKPPMVSVARNPTARNGEWLMPSSDRGFARQQHHRWKLGLIRSAMDEWCRRQRDIQGQGYISASSTAPVPLFP